MKSAKEVWRFVKPYIAKYYLAFLLGGVSWMLLDVYATKGIDASFVSACADVSLVVAAIFAGKQAKKIWQDKFKDESYTYAKKIYLKVISPEPCFDLLRSNLNETSKYVASYMDGIGDEPDYPLGGDIIRPKENRLIGMKGQSLIISDYVKFLTSSIKPLFEKYHDDLNNDLFYFNLAEGVLISGQLIEVHFAKISDIKDNLNNYLKELSEIYSSFKISLMDDYSTNYDQEKYSNMAYEGDFSKVKDAIDKLMQTLNELKENSNDLSNHQASIIKYFKLR